MEHLRVNGQLTVTRSLGTKQLRQVLSAVPDMLLLRLYDNDEDSTDDIEKQLDYMEKEGSEACRNYFITRSANGTPRVHKFLILASDGLWDVFSSQEAVDFTCNHLAFALDVTTKLLPVTAFHTAARALSVEAFMRGSSDNIGVCVVDIL